MRLLHPCRLRSIQTSSPTYANHRRVMHLLANLLWRRRGVRLWHILVLKGGSLHHFLLLQILRGARVLREVGLGSVWIWRHLFLKDDWGLSICHTSSLYIVHHLNRITILCTLRCSLPRGGSLWLKCWLRLWVVIQSNVCSVTTGWSLGNWHTMTMMILWVSMTHIILCSLWRTCTTSWDNFRVL